MSHVTRKRTRDYRNVTSLSRNIYTKCNIPTFAADFNGHLLFADYLKDGRSSLVVIGRDDTDTPEINCYTNIGVHKDKLILVTDTGVVTIYDKDFRELCSLILDRSYHIHYYMNVLTWNDKIILCGANASAIIDDSYNITYFDTIRNVNKPIVWNNWLVCSRHRAVANIIDFESKEAFSSLCPNFGSYHEQSMYFAVHEEFLFISLSRGSISKWNTKMEQVLSVNTGYWINAAIVCKGVLYIGAQDLVHSCIRYDIRSNLESCHISTLKDGKTRGLKALSNNGVIKDFFIWRGRVGSISHGQIVMWTDPSVWSPSNHKDFRPNAREEIKAAMLLTKSNVRNNLTRLPRDILYEVFAFVASETILFS